MSKFTRFSAMIFFALCMVAFTSKTIAQTPITSASVTVTAPVGGTNPDFTAVVASEDLDKYTAVVNGWSDVANSYAAMTTTDEFVAGQDYLLTIVLTPETGYEFSASPTATINGNSAELDGVHGVQAWFVIYFTATEGTGISEILANSISIYPNPTKAELKIESKDLCVGKVEILDILGKTVLTSHETEINISQLSSGTYFVKLKTDKGELTKKVIKE